MTATMFPEFYPDNDGLLKVRCGLYEGTMTIAKKNLAHGSDFGYTFASECQGVDPNAGYQIGDKVVSYGVDSDGGLLVAKHTYNDGLPVVGEIVTKIDFVGVPPVVAGTKTWGNYTPREATILFYGTRIRTLKVHIAASGGGGVNVTAGMHLLHETTTGYVPSLKMSGTSGTVESTRVALSALAAATSAVNTAIPVLEGYEGV